MKIIITTIITAAALALSACGGADEAPQVSTPTVTVTEPAETVVEETEVEVTVTETVQEPAPEPEVVEDEIVVDDDMALALLDIVWEAMGAEEQENICFGWALDEDTMLDSFIEGYGSDGLSREDLRDYFDGVC